MKKGKRKNKRKSEQRHTGLAQHRRDGSVLRSQFSTFRERLEITMWERDSLPEFLWIAALSEDFPITEVHRPYYRFMDIVDKYWPTEEIAAFGLLSDFALIRDRAAEIWAAHEDVLIELFHKPIGRVLAFYPENPASWLIRPELIERDGALDPNVELGRLRKLLMKLYPGRGGDVGHLRVLPLGRLLKHGGIKFPPDPEIIDLFPRYPHATTDDENKMVQSMTRALMNTILPNEKRYQSKAWPKYFWRHNLDLACCNPRRLPIMGTKPLSMNYLTTVEKVLEQNAEDARKYLEKVAREYNYDLYSPERDEILLGLLSRIVRLYDLIAKDANLWARDTAGIMLRCLVDAAITFCYLSEKGDEEDFNKFREYGEGQEKLLMLHLQDTYPEAETLEGRTPDSVSEELGGFTPEILDIELGHWTKKDARKLAISVNMERFYRLVYSPASSDLHGSWFSLKHSSFVRCIEPLHRYHRIPTYMEPLAYLQTINAASEIVSHSFEVGRQRLGFPEAPALKLLTEPQDDVAQP